MRVVPYAEIPSLAGKSLGSSAWVTVDQKMINAFADVTGDHQWIHVDVERAKREIGGTIAHGFLTLSLTANMHPEGIRFEGITRGLNYGSNKLRFTEPVPAGSRIRLHQKMLSVEPKGGGLLMTRENSIEIEGKQRPALIAEWLALVFGA